MSKTAHRRNVQSSRSTARNKNVGIAKARRAGPKSNLLEVLVEARQVELRSVDNLAELAKVTPEAIATLESGHGPVATLFAVMTALPLELNGLSAGRTFGERLRNRRKQRGLSFDEAAAKTSLPRQAIVDLENNGGTVENLLALLAVIAPKVERRIPKRVDPSESTADPDCRFTPDSLMQPIYKTFGGIDVDPCAHPASRVVAQRYFILANGDDGLTQSWSGRVVFMNPPFSKLRKWLRRAHAEWKTGNIGILLCLVPARIDDPFFQDNMMPEASIFSIRDRPPFTDVAGDSIKTSHTLVLVAFGTSAEQRLRFEGLFAGRWLAVVNNHPTTVPGSPCHPSTSVPVVISRPITGTCVYEFPLTTCRPMPATHRFDVVCSPPG